MGKPKHGQRENEQSLAKGMLAGLIGGVVATAAHSVMEKIYPPHTQVKPEAVLADRISAEVGHALTPAEKRVATETIHWSFGALAGTAYGALAEYFPAATARDGASFGLALAALTHETILPAMGLEPGTDAHTTRERMSEMSSLVVYGLVTETVRRFVRPRLG